MKNKTKKKIVKNQIVLKGDTFYINGYGFKEFNELREVKEYLK